MAFARAFLLTGKGVIHDDADDDFALSVGVPRIDDGIHIRPVAQRFNDLKLPDNAAIHLFIAALTQHELILFGEAGQIIHRPMAAFLRGGIIVLDICQGKQMAKRPGNDILGTFIIPVPFLHAPDGRRYIPGQARFFRKYQYHMAIATSFYPR